MTKILFIGGVWHGMYAECKMLPSFVVSADDGEKLFEQKYNLAKFANDNESHFVYVLDGIALE